MYNLEAVDQPTESIEITRADEVAARAYIEAIVRRDPMTMSFGERWADPERARLWMRFVRSYATITRGDYRKHGIDARRVALGAI